MKVDELYKIEEYSEFIKFCSEYEICDVEDLKPSDFVLFQKLSKCDDPFKFKLMSLCKDRDSVELTLAQKNISADEENVNMNHSEEIIDEAEVNSVSEEKKQPTNFHKKIDEILRLLNNEKRDCEDVYPYDKIIENYHFYYNNEELLSKISLEDLDLSVRSYNCLKRRGINNVSELVLLSPKELMILRNLGRKSFIEIIDAISIFNLTDKIDTFLRKQAVAAQGNGDGQQEQRIITRSEVSTRLYNWINENHLLIEEDFLYAIDNRSVDFKYIGNKTLQEIELFIQSAKKTNRNYFYRCFIKGVENIHSDNYDISLEVFFDYNSMHLLNSCDILVVSDFLRLSDEKISKLFSICDKVLNILNQLSISLYEKINDDYMFCLMRNRKGNKCDKDSSRYIDILRARATGFTLEATGKQFSLTRERVRQIVKLKQKHFDEFIRKKYIQHFLRSLLHNASYFCMEDILVCIKQEQVIFSYLLANSNDSYLDYVEDANVFISGLNWVERINNLVDSLPLVIDKTKLAENIENIKKDLKEQDLIIDEFIEKQIEKNVFEAFKLNGAIYEKSSQSLVSKFRIVLENYFADGISVYDDFEIDKFRNCYNKMFSDGAISENNRALVSRITACCVLIGRGKYALKKDSYLSDELLNRIFEFITNSPYDIIMMNTLFSVFEDELYTAGIQNKYFLQGVLRQHFNGTFFFKRDYLFKAKDAGNLYENIIEYVKKENGIVNVAGIKNEFPGVTDIVINIVLSDKKIIGLWNKNYIHADLLSISNEEEDELRAILESAVADNAIAYSGKIYDEICLRCSDVIKQNNLVNHFSMFSVLKHLFADDYNFRRPFVSKIGVEIDGRKERILAFIEEYDELDIEILKEYIEEQGIKIYSMLELINSLDEYVWSEKNHIKKLDSVDLDNSKIETIKNAMDFMLEEDGYVAASQIDYFNLPYIAEQWNEWLLYSIVNKCLKNIDCITTNNFYNTAQPIFIKKELNIRNYEELLEFAIKQENDIQEFKTLDELSKWLTEKGLTQKILPSFLIENQIIAVNENGRIKVQ